MQEQEEFQFHLLSFSSNIIKRVCRSTMQAETYSMQLGVETTDALRASFADMHEQLEPDGWEDSASRFVKAAWLTDCKSAVTALQRPVLAKVQHKRFGIELASLRQSLWRSAKGGRIDPRLVDHSPSDATDTVRWVDTLVMLSDCLTKSMDGSSLVLAIQRNHHSVAQPEEGKAAKARKAKPHTKQEANAESSAVSEDAQNESEENPDE